MYVKHIMYVGKAWCAYLKNVFVLHILQIRGHLQTAFCVLANVFTVYYTKCD